jgi:hypothetical protein
MCWTEVERQQPNPFVELFRNVTAPRTEILQYLMDIGVPM